MKVSFSTHLGEVCELLFAEESSSTVLKSIAHHADDQVNLLSNSKISDQQAFTSPMAAISKSSSPGVSSVRGAKGIVDVDVSQLPDKKLRPTRIGPNMCRVTTKCSIINNLSNLRDCLNLVTASLSAFTLPPAASTPLPSSSTWNLVKDSESICTNKFVTVPQRGTWPKTVIAFYLYRQKVNITTTSIKLYFNKLSLTRT